MPPGTVVQIRPDLFDSFFPGCFMTVEKVATWGVAGYVLCPETRAEPPGLAYYRALWEDIEVVGQAVWMMRSDSDGSYAENVA
jgi:hypothetical protein